MLSCWQPSDTALEELGIPLLARALNSLSNLVSLGICIHAWPIIDVRSSNHDTSLCPLTTPIITSLDYKASFGMRGARQVAFVSTVDPQHCPAFKDPAESYIESLAVLMDSSSSSGSKKINLLRIGVAY